MEFIYMPDMLGEGAALVSWRDGRMPNMLWARRDRGGY